MRAVCNACMTNDKRRHFNVCVNRFLTDRIFLCHWANSYFSSGPFLSCFYFYRQKKSRNCCGAWGRQTHPRSRVNTKLLVSALKSNKSKSSHFSLEAYHLEGINMFLISKSIPSTVLNNWFPEITKFPEMDPSLSLLYHVCVQEGDSIHCWTQAWSSSYAHSILVEVARFTPKIGVNSLAFPVHISSEVGKTLETTLEDLNNYFGFFSVWLPTELTW